MFLLLAAEYLLDVAWPVVALPMVLPAVSTFDVHVRGDLCCRHADVAV
jgi:hypothetical protein